MLRALRFGAPCVATVGMSIHAARGTTHADEVERDRLNQPISRLQGLSCWNVVRDVFGPNHFIERADDTTERYRAPDGSNFVAGVAHPPFIRQRPWDKLRQARPWRETDVHVVTYPKCGTTFMEQIILLLWNDGFPDKLDPKTQNRYDATRGVGKVWAEGSVRVEPDADDPPQRAVMSLADFEALPAPRLIKTHAPRHLFLAVLPRPLSLSDAGRPEPLMRGVKCVYVSRQAKDACVSAYYHAANPHKLGWPFDAWVRNWTSGLFEHGTWADHVAGWRAEALQNPEQVLWVRYEDLVESPEREIRRVASFLGLEPSDTIIERCVSNSSFANMKAQSGNFRFFRSGTVGDHKNHFSAELNAEFDALYAEQMRGVDDPY